MERERCVSARTSEWHAWRVLTEASILACAARAIVNCQRGFFEALAQRMTLAHWEVEWDAQPFRISAVPPRTIGKMIHQRRGESTNRSVRVDDILELQVGGDKHLSKLEQREGALAWMEQQVAAASRREELGTAYHVAAGGQLVIRWPHDSGQ